jgi:hypothetical protein
MFLTTILSFALAALPQEVSISKIEETPREVAQFGGVTVEINQSELQNVQVGEMAVVRDFPLGEDAQVVLRLQRFEVLTEDAEIVTAAVNMNGEVLQRQFDRPNVVLLKGAIEGDPSSRVFLALGEHTTNGLIESNGKTYVLAKDSNKGWTTVYDLTNVDSEKMNWVDFACGVEDATDPIIKKAKSQSRNIVVGCQELQIAVETDWQFTSTTFGGSGLASAEYVVTLLGAVSTIFQANTGVELQLSYLRLWETGADIWDATTTSDQLQEFRNHWQLEMTDVDRHLAHFISGKFLGGGIAWVSGVCTSFGYAVSANMRGSFPLPLEDNHWNNWDVLVVAHELGHNCGTWHTHDYDPPIDNCGNGDCSSAFGGTIMSYCHTCSGGMTNIVLDYDSSVQATMIDYLNDDNTCSLDCDQFLTGACCIDSMVPCLEITEAECDEVHGLFLGIGSLCSMGGCEPLEPGACCRGSDGECNLLDEAVCVDSGGTFLGVEVTCDMEWCAPDAQFACCFGTSCSELSSSECAKQGGYWLGIGTFCEPAPCNPLPNDFCDTAFQVYTGVYDFTSLGAFDSDLPIDDEMCPGQYAGVIMFSDVWFAYTACETGQLLVSTCGLVDFDSTIVVYTGTCEDTLDTLVQVACNGDYGTCSGFTSELSMSVVLDETYFIRVGGFYAESSGVGQLVIGGQNCQDVPCVGDATDDGVVDIQDLLLIIDHWGEDSIQYDIDEDGIVGLGDILFILSNWGHCQ